MKKTYFTTKNTDKHNMFDIKKIYKKKTIGKHLNLFI